ncbi:acyltransferase [Virgibacillus soli]|uniref:Acyltransferase n=2 Tax=Lederbergia galactosidilytica TaxID=217031 RepID=A0A177ZJ34_9BACI|nr:acyltransferase family protein [Lederbergia galactosidilytica]KRG16034.1 acyltransferase [Virgibacillus soli]OAK67784.1 acyltransferase [Lederbergia galactosidilytica]
MANRDSYFDNARFILIFLVVFGHLIQSYIDANTFVATVYKFIYSFHMPAFILVSGFFAKGIYKKGYIKKITKKLIIPYLIFQAIYSIFYYFQFGKSSLEFDLLNPHWSLWFLLSLFCWHLMLLVFNKWKPVYSIGIALAIGLAVGYIDWISNYLSLSRTFVFFPFFLIGYYLKKEHFQKVISHQVKLLAAIPIIAVIILLVIFPNLNETWLLGSKPYSQLQDITILGIFTRTGVYALNFIMAACFFAFVPRKRLFFTKWGRNTLYVYLLHGFIIRTFRGSSVETYLEPMQSIIILVIASFILTLILSSKLVTTIVQPFIELKWSKWKQLLNNLKDSKSNAYKNTTTD